MKEHQSGKTIFQRLPMLNLLACPFRTSALVLLVTLLAFFLFGGVVLTTSLQRGLDSVEARLGAELIAVPLGYENGMSSILLKGEPSYFYLDRSYLEKLSQIDGVCQSSAQFYLTSTNSDCCDFPVQLIGFDPTTDFSIQPWIRESYHGELADGALLVGSDIDVDAKQTLTLFGQEYPVSAQLGKTGSGLDNAVYADMGTLRSMMDAAEGKGFHFLDGTDPDSVISSVLIKIDSTYDVDSVAHNIRSKLNGLQIIKTQSMITGIADSLRNISSLLYVFTIVFFLIALAMLALVFCVTANERKKEFAVLRIMGATRKQLGAVLLTESLMISVSGGVLGIVSAALVVFPFSTAIGQQLSLPYLAPSVPEILPLLLMSLLVVFAVGPLAATYSAWRVSRADASLALREGE